MYNQIDGGAAVQPLCRVLLLEDSTIDAELIEERLKLSFMSITLQRVETERAFIEALQRSRDDYDIILADRSLPGFDGMIALDIARRIAPDLPFVFVSGTIGEEQAIEALRTGATDYVLKHRLARLSFVVRRALAERADKIERRTAEVALRVAEARLVRLLRTIPVGVAEIDASGAFVYTNVPAERILGAQPGELLGRAYDGETWQFRHDDGTDMPRDRLPALCGLRGETVSGVQHAVTTLDGRAVILLVDAVPVWDRGGTAVGALVTFQDVTTRHEQVKALRAATDQLHQAQKMEALGQLTGGIAHDFNNMLQAIGGGLELIQLRLDNNQTKAAARLAADARKMVERASALTERLLAFSRRQTLQPSPVRVDDLIGNMIELIRRTVGPFVDVQVGLQATDCVVECDPNQLENVLLNLSINARDAMPSGGTLRFTTRDVHLDTPEVSAGRPIAPGFYVELTIVDTGTGMDEVTLARAFEPFFTTKPSGQGTGLGLSQTYGFVHQSGGGLQIDSAPGRGTTIRLFLPQHGRRPDVVLESLPIIATPRANHATVLLVEDEEGVRGVLAEQLRESGYTVIEASDGHSALSLFNSGLSADILVTDVGLPNGLNGRQMAEATRERLPELPVLFITGFAGPVMKEQLAAGMEVMGKPFSLETFVVRVQDLLRRSASPPPRLSALRQSHDGGTAMH